MLRLLPALYASTALGAALSGAIGAALGTTLALMPAPARAADDGGAARKRVIEEVTVTARKRAEKLKEVPLGITALGGRNLEQNNRTEFSDYLALVPGVSLGTFSHTESQLTIRGENAGGAGSTVAVYVDDSPFGSSNALADGGVITGNFDTFDLARLEVLRGPQGTLYGANSEGGLLKFVTRAPDLTRFAAKLQVGAEDVQGGNSTFSYKGMVNIPIVTDKLALRLVGFEDGLDGWVNNAYLHEKAVDGGHQWGGRASLLAQPTEALRVRLTGFWQQINASGFPTIDAVGAIDPNNPPPDAFHPIQDLTQRRVLREGYGERLENYAGTIDYDFGPVTLTSVTSWGVIRQTRDADDSLLLVSPPDTTTYSDYISQYVYGQPVGLGQKQYVPFHKFTQEVRLASNGGGRWDWQIGGFYTRESAAIRQFGYTTDLNNGRIVPLDPIPFAAIVDSRYGEGAVFGEATVHITPKLDFTAGGRWAANWQSTTTHDSGPLVGADYTQSGGSRESVFTYSLAPKYHIDDDTLVYGRVATGYRPGGPNIVPPEAPPEVERTYLADDTLNYEIGLRTSLFDHRLSVDVAAFYIDWSSIQVQVVVDNQYTINGNGGNAVSKGFEWAFGLQPIDGLTLNLTGAYTDAHLSSDAPGIGGRSGDPLLGVPKWATTLDGDYALTRLLDWQLSVGGTVAYVGEKYFNFRAANVLARRPLPGYTQVDARISARKGPWYAQVYAKNLGDERAVTFFSGSGGYAAGGLLGVIRPLTVGALISREF